MDVETVGCIEDITYCIEKQKINIFLQWKMAALKDILFIV